MNDGFVKKNLRTSYKKIWSRREVKKQKKYKDLNSLTMFCILFQSDCEPKISKSFTNLIVHERFKNCVWIFCLKACPSQPPLTQPFTKRYILMNKRFCWTNDFAERTLIKNKGNRKWRRNKVNNEQWTTEWKKELAHL